MLGYLSDITYICFFAAFGWAMCESAIARNIDGNVLLADIITMINFFVFGAAYFIAGLLIMKVSGVHEPLSWFMQLALVGLILGFLTACIIQDMMAESDYAL